jgi:hypothetical protein
MKSTFRILGLIALAVIIGFTMTACPNGTPDTPGNGPGGDGGEGDGSGGSSSSQAIQLSEGVWKNGNITAADGEQWFKFTTTSESNAIQYIHFIFGTMVSLNIQLYEVDGTTTVGVEKWLYNTSNYASFYNVLTKGKAYLIKVWPYSSNSNPAYPGTYKIAYNKETTPPNIKLPTEAVLLTEDKWADGSITVKNGEQWYKFTATATPQYIHAKPESLSYPYIQLYDKDGKTVGGEVRLYGSGSNAYASRPVTVGQEYYLKVRAYSESGTYQIGFTKTTTQPTITNVPTNAVVLTVDRWMDDNITDPSIAKWFKFTATANPQYIFGNTGESYTFTLSSFIAQLYDKDGKTVDVEKTFSSVNNNVSRTVTSEQVYYIKVWTTNNNTGTYQIGFTASATAPAYTKLPDATELTADIWVKGKGMSQTDVSWFKFTATADTQYIFADFGTLNEQNGVKMQLFDNTDGYGQKVDSEYRLYVDTNNATETPSVSRTVNSGSEYYIKVWPSGIYTQGTYQIVFSASATPPAVQFPANVTELTHSVWANGNIATPDDEQWFKFTVPEYPTATNSIIYSLGTVPSGSGLYFQLYDSSGNKKGDRALIRLEGIRDSSITVSPGQDYYIKIYSYSTSVSGTYRVTFGDKWDKPSS